jgi:hypothetical protein
MKQEGTVDKRRKKRQTWCKGETKITNLYLQAGPEAIPRSLIQGT